MQFNTLIKYLKKDFSKFHKIKIALLGDTATQFLAKAIRATGYFLQMDIQIYEADYNQIEQQIYITGSELYLYDPEVIVIVESSHKLLQKYNQLSIEARESFACNQMDRIDMMVTTVQQRLPVKIVFCNYSEEDDGIYGSFANKISSSFLFQLRKLNYLLSEYSAKAANFFLSDISSVQNRVGQNVLFSPVFYVNADIAFSLDALPEIASKITYIIAAFIGKQKKCVIVDLDNTLWGGVIGDDGIEKIQIGHLGVGKAFTEFQWWLKKLQQRGIILCVCSKNTEEIAREPFEKHPDMVLKLEDIAVFIANWENKADNIRRIQGILNIGFDSMVFLDDNSFERNFVKENIPDIEVPDLPDDPAEYLTYLNGLNLFETISFSSEDYKRTLQYKEEAKRVSERLQYTSENDFLKNLDMVSEIHSFDAFSIPRVAQLSQRSNQFNLRTIRYTEADIKDMKDDPMYQEFCFTLKDKFGDNGLIAVVILKKIEKKTLFIDSWFMSCRVLKRDMESFTLNEIVAWARVNGYKRIMGEYVPTSKNKIVENHYLNLGFKKINGVENQQFELELDSYLEKKSYIKLMKAD